MVPPSKTALLGVGTLIPKAAAPLSVGAFAAFVRADPRHPENHALVMAIVEAVGYEYARSAMKDAYDPDPNYKDSVYPESLDIPELNRVADTPLKDFAQTYVMMESHFDAFSRAIDKYEGAVDAQDTEWANKQLIAANYYQTMVENDYDQLSPQAKSAAKYLKEKVKLSFTEQEIDNAKDAMKTQGLPIQEVAILKRFGYNDADIEAIKNLNLMESNDRIVNYDQSLVGDLENQKVTLDLIQEDLHNTVNGLGSIHAQVAIKPKTLSMNGNSRWIEASVTIAGYSGDDIDLSSVTLNGVVPAYVEKKHGRDEKPKGKDGKSNPTVTIRFDRKQVLKILQLGTVQFTITGRVADKQFAGSDLVKVVAHDKGDHKGDDDNSSGRRD
jgi:hypothetical protein